MSQYCRYTADIKTGNNIKQLVNRALQFATSDPKGPVYLKGAREVMEEEIQPYEISQPQWSSVVTGPLPETAVADIVTSLVEAENPLVVVGFTGRNPESVPELIRLADLIKGLKIHDAGTTEMCFPFSHRACVGTTTGARAAIQAADVILVLDCDVPWIPTQTRPNKDAKIFHIDLDPLKVQMSLFYIPAVARYRADSCTALIQLCSHIVSSERHKLNPADSRFATRWDALARSHQEGLQAIATRGATPVGGPDAPINISYLSCLLRALVPPNCIFVSEAITNHVRIMEQLQPSRPGAWFTKGAGGLGWTNGAALGVKLATDYNQSHSSRESKTPLSPGDSSSSFVCSITGDGSFLFGIPSSIYWISAHYGIPFLTIILNNGGWVAPRQSARLVNPDGLAQRATSAELNLSFGDEPPASGAVAAASANGRVWKGKAVQAGELEGVLIEAIRTVVWGRSAVVDVSLVG